MLCYGIAAVVWVRAVKRQIHWCIDVAVTWILALSNILYHCMLRTVFGQ